MTKANGKDPTDTQQPYVSGPRLSATGKVPTDTQGPDWMPEHLSTVKVEVSNADRALFEAAAKGNGIDLGWLYQEALKIGARKVLTDEGVQRVYDIQREGVEVFGLPKPKEWRALEQA